MIFDGKHVLVVDDIEANREIFARQLQSLGLLVTCSSNVDDALAALAQAQRLSTTPEVL